MLHPDAPDVTDGRTGDDRGISKTLDATLELLSNRRRRYVLYCLRERNDETTVGDLAERIAEWEDGEDATDAVLADLYHNQLPRLAEEGVITFDAETGCVSLAEEDRPLSEYLDLAADEEQIS